MRIKDERPFIIDEKDIFENSLERDINQNERPGVLIAHLGFDADRAFNESRVVERDMSNFRGSRTNSIQNALITLDQQAPEQSDTRRKLEYLEGGSMMFTTPDKEIQKKKSVPRLEYSMAREDRIKAIRLHNKISDSASYEAKNRVAFSDSV